jgi:hypothetical protein
MTTDTVRITRASRTLFELFAIDAPNWSGTPMLNGNVEITAAERGNLTQLKREGLIETFVSDGEKWVQFTKKGQAYAKTIGMDLDWVNEPWTD